MLDTQFRQFNKAFFANFIMSERYASQIDIKGHCVEEQVHEIVRKAVSCKIDAFKADIRNAYMI